MKIPPPVAELVGFEVVSAGDGHCTMKFEAQQRHANPMGTLHGGILCDVVDGAMGMAFFTTLEPGESFTTLELKINFVRPLTREAGVVRCEGRVVHAGNRTATAEGRITGPDGKLYAHGTTTCIVIEDKSGRSEKPVG